MKTFYVIWTYFANYSGIIEIEAHGPMEAVETLCAQYADEFRQKAKIYVFDTPPFFPQQSFEEVIRLKAV